MNSYRKPVQVVGTTGFITGPSNINKRLHEIDSAIAIIVVQLHRLYSVDTDHDNGNIVLDFTTLGDTTDVSVHLATGHIWTKKIISCTIDILQQRYYHLNSERHEILDNFMHQVNTVKM